jgi:hypothetical protein
MGVTAVAEAAFQDYVRAWNCHGSIGPYELVTSY